MNNHKRRNHKIFRESSFQAEISQSKKVISNI